MTDDTENELTKELLRLANDWQALSSNGLFRGIQVYHHGVPSYQPMNNHMPQNWGQGIVVCQSTTMGEN